MVAWSPCKNYLIQLEQQKSSTNKCTTNKTDEQETSILLCLNLPVKIQLSLIQTRRLGSRESLMKVNPTFWSMILKADCFVVGICCRLCGSSATGIGFHEAGVDINVQFDIEVSYFLATSVKLFFLYFSFGGWSWDDRGLLRNKYFYSFMSITFCTS